MLLKYVYVVNALSFSFVISLSKNFNYGRKCSFRFLKRSNFLQFVSPFSKCQQSYTNNMASVGGDSKLDVVPDVEIDTGRFKYILIKVYVSKGAEEISKHIVRGFASASYHIDIYEEVDAKLHKLGLSAECVGGGRIDHDADKKSILVYGYSQGYGRADHSIATELLKKRYPGYESITWSNDGY